MQLQLQDVRVVRYKTSNLLEKSSSLSLNSLILMNNKTYMTKHHVNVKHTKMYIISKTHYLSFTCRWSRCSCVAPVCLVSAHQTIRICSRPPPPQPPGPGLLLSISSSFIRRNVRYAPLWPINLQSFWQSYVICLWMMLVLISESLNIKSGRDILNRCFITICFVMMNATRVNIALKTFYQIFDKIRIKSNHRYKNVVLKIKAALS